MNCCQARTIACRIVICYHGLNGSTSYCKVKPTAIVMGNGKFRPLCSVTPKPLNEFRWNLVCKLNMSELWPDVQFNVTLRQRDGWSRRTHDRPLTIGIFEYPKWRMADILKHVTLHFDFTVMLLMGFQGMIPGKFCEFTNVHRYPKFWCIRI